MPEEVQMLELNTATEQELIDADIPEEDVERIVEYRIESGSIESLDDQFIQQLSSNARERLQELIREEKLIIDADRLQGFEIGFRPSPKLSGHPELEAEFEYRNQQDERRHLTVPFLFEEDLVVRRFDVSFERPIRTRIIDVDDEVVFERTFNSAEIESSRDGSIFYEYLDINTLAITAPKDHRLVREGRYFVATNPEQRFDGYQLTVAPVESEAEQQATAALLNQEGTPTTGGRELASQDQQATTRLSKLTLSSASFDFDGSFSIDYPLVGDPSKFVGWAWLFAGPSVFFGFQAEQDMATPRYNILIPLPTLSGLPSGERKTVPYDVSESALLNRPDIFADDPGTTCKPFDNPGRILGERRFNTILRITQPDNDETDRAHGEYIDNPRPQVSANNEIDWEGDTTKYQAKTLSRGHILDFRVRWRSNGYSLGNVAHSLTLAPRQTRRIVKVDFERRERAARDRKSERLRSWKQPLECCVRQLHHAGGRGRREPRWIRVLDQSLRVRHTSVSQPSQP